MAKGAPAVTLAGIGLDHASPIPLHRQLYDGLRQAILTGRLRPGARLPSTRALASELGSSRNTVVSAFQQLLAEGYVEGKVGAGTRVRTTLPEDLLQARAEPGRLTRSAGRQRGRSRRGDLLAGTRATVTHDPAPLRPFRPGRPAVNAFPVDLWARLVASHWRRAPRTLLDYGDAAGYGPLREAIAGYLGEARAVRCEARQVIVVAGSQQGLDLAARVLLDPGDAVWVEDPGYLGARGALRAAGARLVPVPVDEEGLNVAAGEKRHHAARLVCVTPSHQYPLGVTMSLGRRLALLGWAEGSGACVVEDDYDSEFRYVGRPLAALQGLDRAGRVIYIGTFSKVLCPALRMGYLVVPPDLVEAFVAARALADRQPPGVEQAVLAEFIREGHFARHIRRMRALYAERQAVLVDSARRELAGLLDVRPAEAGLHVVGWLPAGVDDREASRKALARDIDAPPLSAYYLRAPRRGGLLLGYAAIAPEDIRDGIRRLAAALRA